MLFGELGSYFESLFRTFPRPLSNAVFLSWLTESDNRVEREWVGEKSMQGSATGLRLTLSPEVWKVKRLHLSRLREENFFLCPTCWQVKVGRLKTCPSCKSALR
jgi:hypothetical protein